MQARHGGRSDAIEEARVIDFGQLADQIDIGDPDGVAATLLSADEQERRAAAGWVKEYRHRPLPGLENFADGEDQAFGGRDLPEFLRDQYRREKRDRFWDRREGALTVAGAGCVASVAGVVSWLRSRGSTGLHLPEPCDAVVRLLQAPGRPSISAVATSMAQKMRPTNADQWPLVSRLLRASGLPLPATETMISGWMTDIGVGWAGVEELVSRLRADDRTGASLPEIFAIPRLGARLGANGPEALAKLAGDSAELRRMMLEGCLLRLRAGDRPSSIRAMVDLHQLLAPTLEECADHRQEYLGMLSSPAIAVADVALLALQAVDAGGRLEAEAVAEATYAVLARKEKKLVRAMLDWTGTVLSRGTDPALYTALLTGVHNDAVDLAERALSLAETHLGEYGTAPLSDAAASLGGDLRRQAETILRAAGVQITDDASPGLPAASAVAVSLMPSPIASLAELAGEVKAADRWQVIGDPVLLERVLDGLTRFAYTDRPALTAVIAPMLGEHPNSILDGVLYAIVHAGPRPPRPQFGFGDSSPAPAPYRMVSGRLAELQQQLSETPPAVLLATPATVDGHIDPARLLAAIADSEERGWQPWRYDFTQALLRLPREIDPSVLRQAERLTSPAGTVLTAWLCAGGLPDPSTRPLTVHRQLCATHHPGNDSCWCLQKPPVRRTVAAEAFSHPQLTVPEGLLEFPEASAYERAYGYVPEDRGIGLWPMIFPGHREYVAAHALPLLTTAADGALANQLHVLPALAGSGGPFGPAMALCLAYGLAAGRPSGRAFAVDALALLATRNGPDWTLVGRELGELYDGEAIVLKRVVDSLGDALRAGAAGAVWDIARTLIPMVLSQPGAGAPDLLMTAASAAAAVGAEEDLPEVREVAARQGSTRLITEARRLVRTLSDAPARETPVP